MKQILYKFGNCIKCSYSKGKVVRKDTEKVRSISLVSYCIKTRRLINNVRKIPDWCPLEDVV